MVALLAQNPKAARILAPLCRMLGIDMACLRPAASAVTAAVALLAQAAASETCFTEQALAAGPVVPLVEQPPFWQIW